ncbi:hypothetical protein Pst134EA_019267 [Puccinia striiformis f. sp. tritici]|uniref:hypothetical protein n=1 Tax=Puccinia striiformis f. sp. tritici TaxID=168172 RepID=UPI00200876D3|nr:hypothetical protein Pst134EA_019267 [Puccinia striiformis f. sp. tritici]KAH9459114.1 hypothetical protein Pst134EA_019267 [Puccinia striiformis f. sp. tritici]
MLTAVFSTVLLLVLQLVHQSKQGSTEPLNVVNGIDGVAGLTSRNIETEAASSASQSSTPWSTSDDDDLDRLLTNSKKNSQLQSARKSIDSLDDEDAAEEIPAQYHRRPGKAPMTDDKGAINSSNGRDALPLYDFQGRFDARREIEGEESSKDDTYQYNRHAQHEKGSLTDGDIAFARQVASWGQGGFLTGSNTPSGSSSSAKNSQRPWSDVRQRIHSSEDEYMRKDNFEHHKLMQQYGSPSADGRNVYPNLYHTQGRFHSQHEIEEVEEEELKDEYYSQYYRHAQHQKGYETEEDEAFARKIAYQEQGSNYDLAQLEIYNQRQARVKVDRRLDDGLLPRMLAWLVIFYAGLRMLCMGLQFVKQLMN